MKAVIWIVMLVGIVSGCAGVSDGSSYERAFFIRANTEEEGWMKIDSLIGEKFPRAQPYGNPAKKELGVLRIGGRSFYHDRIVLADGSVRWVYFDVSSFFQR